MVRPIFAKKMSHKACKLYPCFPKTAHGALIWFMHETP